jgi:hypothetical protein
MFELGRKKWPEGGLVSGLRDVAVPDHDFLEHCLVELPLDPVVSQSVGVGAVGGQPHGQVEDRMPFRQAGVGRATAASGHRSSTPRHRA